MERLLLEPFPFAMTHSIKIHQFVLLFFSGDEKQIEMREKMLMIVVNRAEWQM